MARKAAVPPGNESSKSSRASGRAAAAGDTADPDAAGGATGPKASRTAMGAMSADPEALARMMTPERALELYKANAELALEVINAALEGTSRVRRKQFEGEEAAREFQQRHARRAAEARDPQSLLAAQQGATQEAMERSMRYWTEMFDLIVEIQKRLFTLMQEQMEAVPGVRESRAAMTMFPDLGEMQKVVSAMQGLLASGNSTFESMQRVMGDFVQRSTPGRAR